RNVPSDTGNLHRLTENLAALFPYALHRGFDVIHADDDGRVLRRPVGLLREQSAIDGASGSARLYIRLGRSDEYVVAHVRAEHLRLPAEGCVYRKSDSAILVMKAAEDRLGCDDAEALNRPMEWGILVQRAMNARFI